MAATQAVKLGIRADTRVRLDQPPEAWRLESPHPATDEKGDGRPADLVIAFLRQAVELDTRLARLGREVFPAGVLWVAWPRRAGGHRSDITDGSVRSTALSLGLVDVKVAALDEDWSALKLIWRKELR